MATKALKFLHQLATDPGVMSAYLRDPAGAMKKAGLSKAAQEALASGEAIKIHEALNLKGLESSSSNEQQSEAAHAPSVETPGAGVVGEGEWKEDYFYQWYLWWLSAHNIPLPEYAMNGPFPPGSEMLRTGSGSTTTASTRK